MAEPKRAAILVVEDNEVLRFLVKAQMSNLQVDVEFAVNGKEAVEKVRQRKYDLVLMDIMMPVMDGCEACKLIREDEKESSRPRTPIVAMTAYSDSDQCHEAGMDDFLFKPVMIDQLKKTIERWAVTSA